MRVVRQIATTLLDRGLPYLEDASPRTICNAYEYFRWIGLRWGLPLPEIVDARFLRNAVSMVARALIDTPYGHPLRFEFPLIITLSISDYCPFACTNCYSNSGHIFADEPATDGVEATFEKVANSTTPFVLITGGEPLASQRTHPGVLTLLKAGKWVLLSTNASIASYLDVAERYPSTFTFLLPIWGRRERHNELRGQRSFERVEQNLELLNRRGLHAYLLVVLGDADLGVFEDVLKLVQQFAVSAIRVNRKVHVGRHDNVGPEISDSFVFELRKQARELRRHVPFFFIDIPELRHHPSRTLVRSVLGIPQYESCAAGNWMMHIDSRGSAFPCYTFEPSGKCRVPSNLSLFDQWQRVQEARTELGNGDICVGEAQSR
jgi:MoaA/NifB/PqqE/SkfB family radical SAM enzyme